MAKEITIVDLVREIKQLRQDIENIREMIYEVNSDYFNMAQIYNFNNRYPKEIIPLTNRELILYALQKYPAADPETGREKLQTKEELINEGIPEEFIKFGFEEKRDLFDEI